MSTICLRIHRQRWYTCLAFSFFLGTYCDLCALTQKVHVVKNTSTHYLRWKEMKSFWCKTEVTRWLHTNTDVQYACTHNLIVNHPSSPDATERRTCQKKISHLTFYCLPPFFSSASLLPTPIISIVLRLFSPCFSSYVSLSTFPLFLFILLHRLLSGVSWLNHQWSHRDDKVLCSSLLAPS